MVTVVGVADPSADNRWSLLSSAARLYNAELHFVVPKWDPRASVDTALRRRLQRLELAFNRVWNV